MLCHKTAPLGLTKMEWVADDKDSRELNDEEMVDKSQHHYIKVTKVISK